MISNTNQIAPNYNDDMEEVQLGVLKYKKSIL